VKSKLVPSLGWLVALAFVLSLGTEALAAPPGPDTLPVAVVGVKSDDALDAAEALTTVLRKAVRDSEGWSLGEATQALEFLALQMNCSEPIDAACETRIADVIKADRFLWCVVNFEDSTKQMVRGTLNFFVRGKGTNKVALRYSANLTDPTDDALVRVARDAVNAATGGPPKGGLKVSTGGVAGQLYVDDKPIGALAAEGGTFQLPSGQHTIVVKARGYADSKTTAQVKPATTVDVSLTMVAVQEDKPLDGRMIGGFVSLGVGAAAGAVGLWAALDVNGIRNDPSWSAYRRGIPGNKDACQVARDNVAANKGMSDMPPDAATDAAVVDFCDTAGRAELIQAITFPVAAVAAGVGAYLLGTSSLAGGDEAPTSALTVEPMIGVYQQSLTVRYRF
jgi:hypothetical protein